MLTNIKKKSSYSGWPHDPENQNCVEARVNSSGMVEITDSKMPDVQIPKFFTANEWRAFIAGAKAGEFDLLSGD